MTKPSCRHNNDKTCYNAEIMPTTPREIKMTALAGRFAIRLEPRPMTEPNNKKTEPNRGNRQQPDPALEQRQSKSTND
jgi:hypothetical protein